MLHYGSDSHLRRHFRHSVEIKVFAFPPPRPRGYDAGMNEELQKTIVFSVLGVLAAAFAAFCVWLTVRIVNRRERWAKRLAVVLAVATVVGYPLSIGPVAFLSRHSNGLPEAIYAAYVPLQWVYDISPRPIQEAMTWYADDLWK